MQYFRRCIIITNVDQIEPMIQFISDITKVDYEEVAELFGLIDYDDYHKDVELVNLEAALGKWEVHIEDTFDRAGRVQIRVAHRQQEKFQDIGDIMSKYKAIRKVAEIDEAAYLEIHDILAHTRCNPEDATELWRRIDELDPDNTIMKKHDIINRIENLLLGNMNEFMDYTGLPGTEWYD